MTAAAHRTETITGAVVLAVAAGFLAWAAGGELFPRGGYEVTASFPDVDGVEIGTEVRLAGVRIGRVSALSLNPETYMADARLTSPEGIVLPADSAARLPAGCWVVPISRSNRVVVPTIWWPGMRSRTFRGLSACCI